MPRHCFEILFGFGNIYIKKKLPKTFYFNFSTYYQVSKTRSDICGKFKVRTMFYFQRKKKLSIFATQSTKT